jgi:hypothetical protein
MSTNCDKLRTYEKLVHGLRMIMRRVMIISHGALIIAKGSKLNGLYILKGSTVISNALVTSVETADITKLWHLKLGNVTERVIVWLPPRDPTVLAKQGLLGQEN